jgi:ParB/RepB/Spo0J family partition protein
MLQNTALFSLMFRYHDTSPAQPIKRIKRKFGKQHRNWLEMQPALPKEVREEADRMQSKICIQEISVDSLGISNHNVRVNPNELNGDCDTSIHNLAQSIATQGLINPISVRPMSDGKYEVVAGHRRLLAVKILGWKTITCSVAPADMTDSEAKVHSLVENFQRQDNSYSDKVSLFSALLNGYCGNDISKLCKLVGIERKTAERYLAMSKLPAASLAALDVLADPWIYNPLDRNKFYKITNIHKAFALLMREGCLLGGGGNVVVEHERSEGCVAPAIDPAGAVAGHLQSRLLVSELPEEARGYWAKV